MMTDHVTQQQEAIESCINHRMRLYGERRLLSSSKSVLREYDQETYDG